MHASQTTWSLSIDTFDDKQKPHNCGAWSLVIFDKAHGMLNHFKINFQIHLKIGH